MFSIANNLAAIRQQIAQSEAEAQREPGSVTLLAVSKTRPADDIRQAFAADQRHFGENYLQEALDKMAQLSDLPLLWHYIGPLQSNKTRKVAENFSWVHSVDRLKVASRLSEQRPTQLPDLNICLQVNISGEDSKSGCAPEEVLPLAEAIRSLPHIRLRGLMAIPQASDDQAELRQAFHAMKQLLDQLQSRYPEMDTLSMGMSGDMSLAIAEGATMVRIGTAIFGARTSH